MEKEMDSIKLIDPLFFRLFAFLEIHAKNGTPIFTLYCENILILHCQRNGIELERKI